VAGGRVLIKRPVRAVGVVKPGRGSGLSTGPFPRTASRTRRAAFTATGSPQVLGELAGLDVILPDHVLDSIDEIVPPGADVALSIRPTSRRPSRT
jgi:hypothetical protein